MDFKCKFCFTEFQQLKGYIFGNRCIPCVLKALDGRKKRLTEEEILVREGLTP